MRNERQSFFEYIPLSFLEGFQDVKGKRIARAEFR